MHLLNKKYHHNNKHEQSTDPSRHRSYSRRQFLRQAFAISAAGLVGPGLLAACSSGEDARTRQSGGASTEAAASSKCDSSVALSASDNATHQAVDYVDESPQAGKACANCRFFKKPKTNPTCGGCQIVAGPITPEGYCTAWVGES